MAGFKRVQQCEGDNLKNHIRLKQVLKIPQEKLMNDKPGGIWQTKEFGEHCCIAFFEASQITCSTTQRCLWRCDVVEAPACGRQVGLINLMTKACWLCGEADSEQPRGREGENLLAVVSCGIMFRNNPSSLLTTSVTLHVCTMRKWSRSTVSVLVPHSGAVITVWWVFWVSVKCSMNAETFRSLTILNTDFFFSHKQTSEP